jgi:apolipoprotein N-acyltransferase
MAVPPASLIKPTAAFILSLIGGILILLWGLVLVAVGVAISSSTLGVFGGDVLIIGGVELVCGLIVLIAGIFLYVNPEQHTMFGVLVVVFSIVSLVGLGGLLLGFILALIGGILGITHKPTPPAPTVVYVQPQRVCPKCGRVAGPGVQFCAFCGNPLG